MSKKKKMGIIVSVIIGGLGLFIFMLYATVKTKSTSLNKHAPFQQWIGKTVLLERESVLFKEKVQMNDNSDYPFILLDSLHPQWAYVEERKNRVQPELEQVAVFPAGTTLFIEKAVQYTNGVSGSSYPTVFGSISADGKMYNTGYQWGMMDKGKRFDKIEKCWKFHQAPWQETPDTAYYELPTADLW